MIPVGLLSSGDQEFYNIENSGLFDSSDSSLLTRTPSEAGNRKKWTISLWVKRASTGKQDIMSAGTSDADRVEVGFEADNTLVLWSRASSTNAGHVNTDALFLDVGAWYHIVISFDAANTSIKFYANGTELAQTVTIAPANVNHAINSTHPHTIGNRYDASLSYMNGYLADIHFIDGQNLGPDSFGQTLSGARQEQRVPIEYDGSYGTNGFHLDFANATHFGNDVSENGNDFTDSGFTTDHQVLDTPTNNMPVFNPLHRNTNYGTLSNGNRTHSSSSTKRTIACSTISVPLSKKVVWAVSVGNLGNGDQDIRIGWAGFTDAAQDDSGGVGPSVLIIRGASFWTVRDFDNANQLTDCAVSTADTLYVAHDGPNDLLWAGIYDDSTSTMKWIDSTGGNTGNPATGANPTRNSGTELHPFAIGTRDDSELTIITDESALPAPIPAGFQFLFSANDCDGQGAFTTYTSCATEDEDTEITYTGNGVADGPFIYLGYCPEDICIDGTHYDGVGDHTVLDFMSNGVKLRSTTHNTDGVEYTLEAWGKRDFKYANGITNE